jgi:MFS family permease
MELTLVPLLLPLIQNAFDLTIGQLAWLFNSYGIAVAAGVLIGGVLGDAINVRRVFAGGVLAFALGSLLVAAASSFEMMIAGRIVQGVGGGVFSPLIPILLTRASPDQPGKVLIIWGSIAGYVAAFAPLLLSGLFAISNWNLAFLGFAVISLLALVVVHLGEIDPASTTRVKTTQSLLRIFQTSKLWLMYGYVFCTYGCITYFLFRMPLWLEDSGYQIVGIGLVLSSMWLSFSLVGTVMRNLVDKPAVRLILVLAPLFIAGGFQLANLGDEMILLIFASILIGCGFACSNAPSTQFILSFAPKSSSALSASLDITFARLGGVFTVAVLAQSSMDVAVYTTLVLSAIGTLFAILATRRTVG